MSSLLSSRLVRFVAGFALSLILFIASMTLGAAEARAESSHKMINYHRSSVLNYMYVANAIEGEYGSYISELDGGESTDELWQGYGFRNGLGMELLKFIQLSANHTFINNSSKDDSSKRLTGSRLSGEMKLVFNAPVANLELGGGMIASRLDYQHLLDHSTMYGSGVFYNMGLNYFVSQKVSFFGNVKQNKENLLRGSGSRAVKRIKTDTMSMGAGFSVWL